jgi:hypothetical protein
VESYRKGRAALIGGWAPISVIGANAALLCRSSITCYLIVGGHNEVVIDFWV